MRLMRLFLRIFSTVACLDDFSWCTSYSAISKSIIITSFLIKISFQCNLNTHQRNYLFPLRMTLQQSHAIISPATSTCNEPQCNSGIVQTFLRLKIFEITKQLLVLNLSRSDRTNYRCQFPPCQISYDTTAQHLPYLRNVCLTA